LNMSAFTWLNRLRKSESGNIIAIGAAAMPMLIGSAALAVDTIQLSLWKRQLQRAADSGAIAGAYSLSQGRNDAQIETSVENDLTDNTHPPLVGEPTIERGPRGGYTQAVYVALTAERTLPFMHMFTGSPARLQADAAAAIVSQGRYCMVSLYNGTAPGITLGGNASVTLGCGMITNSRAASAVTTGGAKSFIVATPVGAVGGLDGDVNNFSGETELVPYTAPQSDPFAGVPNPDTSPCVNPQPLDVSGAMSIDVSGAGKCYSSLNVSPSGSLTLTGTGPLIIYGGNAEIKGDVKMGTGSEGQTLVMTGPENADGSVSAGNLSMHSQANFSMTAPTSGDYAGLVFYRDRRAPASTMVIRGGASSRLAGGFYAATSNFDFAGNSGFDAECLMMVGQIIAFTGTSDLVNDCPANSDVNPISRSIVRLVE
jgi:Flp pilus assembly protein TadG